MKAPQDQKGELINVIASLKTSTKPKGQERADLGAWWNQLRAKKIGEIWRCFRVSSARYFGK